MAHPKRVVVLGATGSVGQTVLRVIADHRKDFEVVAISCHRNFNLAQAIIQQFSVPNCCIVDENIFLNRSEHVRLFRGLSGLSEMVAEINFDLLVVAISGVNGLQPTLCAIDRGKDILLASKEILVEAGSIVMRRAKEQGVHIIPLDSEHSAIFQCLQGHSDPIQLLQLTASGGKFWNASKEIIEKTTVKDVLKHPKWSMGAKITVDSSTMANKGLEIIEAMHLFNVRSDQIQVFIHPECIVHSLVGFTDGNFLAQLAPPSMVYAARYGLFFPNRCFSNDSEVLDLAAIQSLHFYNPDFEKFPCLRLAYQVAKMESSMHIAYNAANEVAVTHFLEGKISFTDIPKILEKVLEQTPNQDCDTLDEVLAMDQEVRTKAVELNL